VKKGDKIKVIQHYDDEPGFCVIETEVIKVDGNTVVVKDISSDEEEPQEVTYTRQELEAARTEERVGHHG
jgi:hypothetical protein